LFKTERQIRGENALVGNFRRREEISYQKGGKMNPPKNGEKRCDRLEGEEIT